MQKRCSAKELKCEAGKVQERLSVGKAIRKGEVQKGEVQEKVMCKKGEVRKR